jgi:hypothetical protein
VEAIDDDDPPEEFTVYPDDNARFLTDPLPGQKARLGSPGGEAKVGLLTVDTPMATALAPEQR